MDSTTSRARRVGALAAVGAAGVVAGAILFGVTGANAADSTPAPSASSSTGSGQGDGTAGSSPDGTARQGGRGPGGMGPGGMGHDGDGVPGGAESVRPDEKNVTGDTLTTLTAKALKAVPGGTVVRVETDSGDGAYEAHMTKADGTVVTVKFDKNLSVIEVQDGMGTGDPQLAPPAGTSDDRTSGSGSSSSTTPSSTTTA